MQRVLKPGLAGLLSTLALAAPAAAATVSVRVEGSSRTLVRQVEVRPSSDVVVDKTATGGTTCAGTSGGGALELATGGDWGGPAFSFGQSIETIRGESHTFDSEAYWSLYVNNEASELGLCDFTPAQGDEILLFPACTAEPRPTCASDGPLDLRGPASATPGKAFTVRVDEYAFDGTRAPSADATIALPGGRTVATGPQGTARVRLDGRGRRRLTVTKPGHVRDELAVCLSAGCRKDADHTSPRVRIRGIEEGERFARGPRTLRARATDADSGVATVRFSLVRRAGGTCTAFSARRETFVRSRCARGPRFAVGTGSKVSYLLPRRLPRGAYRLEAVAVDRAGNRATDRVAFTVR